MLERNFAGPSKEAIEKFARHGECTDVHERIPRLIVPELEADTDERKSAIMTNAHFRLMLNLLAFKRSEESDSKS